MDGCVAVAETHLQDMGRGARKTKIKSAWQQHNSTTEQDDPITMASPTATHMSFRYMAGLCVHGNRGNTQSKAGQGKAMHSAALFVAIEIED